MTDNTNMDVMRKQAMKKKKNMKIFLIFALATLFVFFLIFMYMNFFNIRSIMITGLEDSSYTEDEMIEATGVSKGDNLLSLSSEQVSNNLMDRYPYIKKVKVTKSFPTKLKVSVEFHDAVMALELGEDVFLLSRDASVLGTATDEQLEEKKYCYITTPFIVKCIEGDPLEFKSEDSFKVLVDIYSAFENNGIAARLTQLNTSDKYNVKAEIDGRFSIIFGSYEQSDEKARLLSEVLKGDLWTDTSGEIDVSDVSSAVVRVTGSAAT